MALERHWRPPHVAVADTRAADVNARAGSGKKTRRTTYQTARRDSVVQCGQRGLFQFIESLGDFIRPARKKST
jgi:hypothetical protein